MTFLVKTFPTTSLTHTCFQHVQQQQDAAELLTWLFDALHKALNNPRRGTTGNHNGSVTGPCAHRLPVCPALCSRAWGLAAVSVRLQHLLLYGVGRQN